MRPVAVVPVKAFGQAKQRLAACCDGPQRHALARAMLEDVLDALAATPGLAGVLLVTGDAEAVRLARRRGLDTLAEPRPGNLNAAVSAAARHLLACGERAMLVVPADAPGVRSAEIEYLLARHAAGRRAVTIVPSHDHGGTNALLLEPPDALAPGFGADSFRGHLLGARASGHGATVLALPGLGLDLDHPQDLQRFARTPSDTRTWRLLQAVLSPAPAPRIRHPSAWARSTPTLSTVS